MTDEEVDKFKPSRSAIKLGERAGVGNATGVDIVLTVKKRPKLANVHENLIHIIKSNIFSLLGNLIKLI